MPLRVLNPAEEREYDRLHAENLADFKAGKFKDAAESVAALYAATAHLGTAVPDALVAKAVSEHGHLGLAALNVAAEWTLTRRTAAPRRMALRRTQPRSRRRRTTRRARSPGRRTSADDGDPDQLRAFPLEAFRLELDRVLGDGS